MNVNQVNEEEEERTNDDDVSDDDDISENENEKMANFDYNTAMKLPDLTKTGTEETRDFLNQIEAYAWIFSLENKFNCMLRCKHVLCNECAVFLFHRMCLRCYTIMGIRNICKMYKKIN
jgi:hypothetical protein